MDESYKRHMANAVPASHPAHNTNVEGLATVGMRIRMAVARGYNNVQVEEDTNINGRRMPLPAHLNDVPSLSNMGSTIESSSDLNSWEARYQPQLQTISQNEDSYNKNKRTREVEDYNTGYAQVHHSGGAVDFQAKYGELRFDEDF